MRDWQRALAGIVALTRKGDTLNGCCPIHREKTASFYVYSDGHYHCYGCGAHGWCDTLLGEKPPPRKSVAPIAAKSWPTLYWAILTQNARETHVARRVARWRGYSERFCEWLIGNSHLGAVEGQICFPIRADGRIVRAHVRRDESIDWKARGKSPWFYYPTVGASVDAMVIQRSGDYANVFESQWDLFAVLDQTRGGGQWIATRGASNSRKLAAIQWPAVVTLWPQSDEAAETWLKATLAMIPTNRKVRVCWMPDRVKDANDYARAGGEFRSLERSLIRTRGVG